MEIAFYGAEEIRPSVVFLDASSHSSLEDLGLNVNTSQLTRSLSAFSVGLRLDWAPVSAVQ